MICRIACCSRMHSTGCVSSNFNKDGNLLRHSGGEHSYNPCSACTVISTHPSILSRIMPSLGTVSNRTPTRLRCFQRRPMSQPAIQFCCRNIIQALLPTPACTSWRLAGRPTKQQPHFCINNHAKCDGTDSTDLLFGCSNTGTPSGSGAEARLGWGGAPRGGRKKKQPPRSAAGREPHLLRDLDTHMPSISPGTAVNTAHLWQHTQLAWVVTSSS